MTDSSADSQHAYLIKGGRYLYTGMLSLAIDNIRVPGLETY